MWWEKNRCLHNHKDIQYLCLKSVSHFRQDIFCHSPPSSRIARRLVSNHCTKAHSRASRFHLAVFDRQVDSCSRKLIPSCHLSQPIKQYLLLSLLHQLRLSIQIFVVLLSQLQLQYTAPYENLNSFSSFNHKSIIPRARIPDKRKLMVFCIFFQNHPLGLDAVGFGVPAVIL